jgi:hypothetical protein
VTRAPDGEKIALRGRWGNTKEMAMTELVEFKSEQGGAILVESAEPAGGP